MQIHVVDSLFCFVKVRFVTTFVFSGRLFGNPVGPSREKWTTAVSRPGPGSGSGPGPGAAPRRGAAAEAGPHPDPGPGPGPGGSGGQKAGHDTSRI